MHIRKFLFVVVISFGVTTVSVSVFALNQTKPLNQYKPDVWQTEDGLPQNSVKTITQTRDGYLWFGTNEGLVRFDGMRFVVFDKRNTEQIKDNVIHAVLASQAGDLWIGTPGGLCRLKDGKFTAYTVKDGLSHNTVRRLYEGRDGTLWIATLGGGINRWKDGIFTAYTTREGLSSNSVSSIFEDREGSLWIGTPDAGLNRLKDNEVTIYTTSDGLPDNAILSLCGDAEGKLWIGTRTGGLSYFQDNKFTTYTTHHGLSSEHISALSVDRAGTLWIATTKGLNRFVGGAFDRYSIKEGLSNGNVLSVYEDREGSLWVGTQGGGLNRLKDTNFTSLTTQQGLSSDIILPVYEDHEGSLWISAGGTLNKFSGDKFTPYPNAASPQRRVLSLYDDRQGNLWIGTEGGGLTRLREGRFTVFTTKDGLSSDFVLSITGDRQGNLWVGTSEGGLNRFKDEKFTVYTTKDGLSDNTVRALLEDREGNLWIGTNVGLSSFRDGVFNAHPAKDELSAHPVMSIYEDGEGSIWVGTNGGGLKRVKKDRVSVYTVKHGLFDDVAFQILEDGKGNLWASCNKGVYRVSKRVLDDFDAGKISAISCDSYGKADGMRSAECNGGFQPAGWKTRDGKLWFPTIKGVAVVDPEKIELNEQPPPTLIEQVIVDGESLDLLRGRESELPPGKDNFEIHYTGLSFLAPEKMRFKYKLEGFDADWVDAGARRVAFYTNLSHGHYRFRVLASNNDGVWNQDGASINFYLKPYFYQTYWFGAFCLLAIAIIGWGLYRLRVNQLRTQFSMVLAERSRIAREIHDTLAQGFAGISVQLESVSELLSASPQLAEKHLDQARSLVRRSMSEARRSIWDLRPEVLENGNLTDALSEIAHQLTASTPIRVQLQLDGTPRRLPAIVETNLFRIGQEALVNAVRHADAQQLSIILRFAPHSVLLRVEDNGHGFDVQATSATRNDHFGLLNIRERAERIGGQLNINSSPQTGTAITVAVPIK